MLQRLAQALGHAHGLAGIHTVAPTGAQLAADPIAARALLAQACGDVVRQMGVQAVILGGAGLAGMAAAVQPIPTGRRRADSSVHGPRSRRHSSVFPISAFAPW